MSRLDSSVPAVGLLDPLLRLVSRPARDQLVHCDTQGQALRQALLEALIKRKLKG